MLSVLFGAANRTADMAWSGVKMCFDTFYAANCLYKGMLLFWLSCSFYSTCFSVFHFDWNLFLVAN